MAEQTIDKLQVEVEATAKGTSAVFRQLESQLSTLSRALSAIDTSKLTAVQKSVNNTKVGLDTSGITKSERQISNSVAKIQQALVGLKAYQQAALNGDTSAATSFERRVVSIKSAIDMLEDKLKKMPEIKIETEEWKKVQSDIENTNSRIQELINKRDQLGEKGNTQHSQEYLELTTQINRASEALGVLLRRESELKNSGGVYDTPLNKYMQSLIDAKGQLQQMSESVENVIGASSKTINPKADSSSLRALNNELKETRINFFKLDDACKNFASKVGGLFKGIGKAIFGIGSGLKNLTDKGFLKLLKYGLGIRSIYVLFRRLRKAITDSFEDLQKSGAFFATTAANVQSLKTALATLKFQFGAAFEPIFNAVAPALQALIDYLVTAANVISAFMARLTGKSTYSKVESVTLAAKKNLGGAAKNAKELNKQLQKFDELNNLTTNNGSGGGGGGGGSTSDHATYVEESVDSVLGDFGKNLADKIRQGDWEGVGNVISEKLSEVMEGIPWDDIYEKARGFGKGLADFLNGLINPRLFGNLGKTLANSINTAFEFLNTFGNEFSWTNFGNSLGQGITDFFKNADFALWGSTVHTWIGGILDAGIALIDNTDWAEIGNKLGEFLENLNIPDLAMKLAKLAGKLALGIGEALLNLATHGEVGAITAGLIAVLGTVIFTNKLGGIAAAIASALGAELSIGITLSGAIPIFLTAGLLFHVGKVLYKYLGNEYDSVGEMFEDLVGIFGVSSENTKKTTGIPEKPEKPNENGGMRNYYTDKYGLTTPEVWDEYERQLKEYNEYVTQKQTDFSKLFKPNQENKGMANYYTNLYGLTHADLTGKSQKEYEDTMLARKNARENAEITLGHSSKPLMEQFGESLSGFWDWFIRDDDGWGGTWEKRLTPVFDKIFGSADTSGILDTSDTSMLGAWNSFFGTGNTSSGFFKNIGKSLDTINKKFQTTSKTQDKFLETTKKGSKTSGKALKDNYDTGAIKPVGEAFSKVYDAVSKIWSKSGEDSKKYSYDFYTGFNSMPDETSARFALGYSQSTGKWSAFGDWVKGKANTINRGFDGTPTETSNKFGEAYNQSTNKWTNIGNWIKEKANIVNTGFNGFPSATATKFGEAYTQGTSKFNNTGSWIQGVYNTISQKISTVPGEFDAKFKSAADNATKQTKAFTDWFQNVNLTREASLSFSATGSNEFNIGSIVSSVNNVIHKFNESISLAIGKMNAANKGRMTLSFTAAKDIYVPYARGGVIDSATLALMGEAGTEAVVPLENNTKWLGKMADMMVGEMVKPQHLSIATSIASPYSSGGDASSVAEQNALLREEVQLLRQIAAKDFSIGSRDVYDAVRKENDDYINRMGYSPLFS